MDRSIKSLIEKRKLLKWTIRELAEKADVPYSAALRIERGVGFWDDFASRLIHTVNKGLKDK